MTRPHTTPADHPTTQPTLYVGAEGRAHGVGPMALPREHAARHALTLARAGRGSALVYADAHGEPIARVASDGSIHVAASEDEIARMPSETFRSAPRDSDGRIYGPVVATSLEAVRDMAADLAKKVAPNPEAATRAELGKWIGSVL